MRSAYILDVDIRSFLKINPLFLEKKLRSYCKNFLVHFFVNILFLQFSKRISIYYIFLKSIYTSPYEFYISGISLKQIKAEWCEMMKAMHLNLGALMLVISTKG